MKSLVGELLDGKWIQPGVIAVAMISGVGHMAGMSSWLPMQLGVAFLGLVVSIGVVPWIVAIFLGPPLRRLRVRFRAPEVRVTQAIPLVLAAWGVAWIALHFLHDREGKPSFASLFLSQWNLLWATGMIVLWWVMRHAKLLKKRRANRTMLALNLAILWIVVQASLQASRMHIPGESSASASVAVVETGLLFLLFTLMGTFLSWLFVKDATAALEGDRALTNARVISQEREHGTSRNAGLALSGGGIRAATVGAGVLEALEKSGMLSRFRYVSAVSGGSWAAMNYLSSLIAGEPHHVTRLAQRRDYLRRSGRLKWMVLPVAIALLGFVLQLVSILLAIFFLAIVLVYLAELGKDPKAIWFAWLMKWATSLGKSLSCPRGGVCLPLDAQDLTPLQTAAGVAVFLVGMGAVSLALGATGLLATRTRVAPSSESFLRHCVTLIWVGIWCVLLFGLPLLSLVHFSGTVALAIVLLAGGIATAIWRIRGLQIASLFSVLSGAVVFALDPPGKAGTWFGNAVTYLDSLWISGLSLLVKATVSLGDLLKTIPADDLDRAFGLQLAMGFVGFAYLTLSWLIRLEAVGLGDVWRSWVGVFVQHGRKEENSLTWKDLKGLPPSVPIPIINIAANVPREKRPTRHFEMTPFTIGGPTMGWRERKDEDPEPVDAIAISSAALNSQAGRFVPQWLRPVLSVLSFKLGRWVRHPMATTASPPLALQYMTREIMGWNSLFDSQLFLSDGGHFENLGVYALLLRDVDTIVCVDAAADPEYAFDDLSRLIELGRYQGATLEGLDLSQHVPASEATNGLRLPATAVSSGVWRFKDRSVRFIYAKLSLVDGLTAQAYAFARQNADFPQQTTADQFFDERQMQAYLELGKRLGEAVSKKLAAPDA